MGELDYDELTGSEWVYDEEGTGNEEDVLSRVEQHDFLYTVTYCRDLHLPIKLSHQVPGFLISDCHVIAS